jgi:hypothetical protein
VNNIKLNIGASPIWQKSGWHTLDHKAREESETSVLGDASNIPLEESSCRTLFCSHMIEHIPHTKLESILLEFNRVLERDGILRLLTPDLNSLAKAYANRDEAFFIKALIEDENIRTDLGFGGMLMNFIVSPGQDTALLDRNLNNFISGYAHIYSYDFEMLRILLERCGFYHIEQKKFCDSELKDYNEPLHVVGFEPIWQNFNKAFYEKNQLVHHYDDKAGTYNINFKVTGFDRDPVTSLIIEAKKKDTIDLEKFRDLNESKTNYNRYGQSLLKGKEFSEKLKALSEFSSQKTN